MKGKLAICSLGYLGLITEDEPRPVKFLDGTDGTSYVGIHLTSDHLVKAGQPWSSRNPNVIGELPTKGTYQTFEEAIELVKDARGYQAKAWPNTELTNAGGRPFEEWMLLLHHYMTKLDAVYTETPGNLPTVVGADGRGREYRPNIEGRKRVRKYAAIVANLAIWAVQSALGSAYAD
jgi:hypothetical protein